MTTPEETEMKYPIFAFVAGGLFVELAHAMAGRPASDPAAFLLGSALLAVVLAAAAFEAIWNFK